MKVSTVVVHQVDDPKGSLNASKRKGVWKSSSPSVMMRARCDTFKIGSSLEDRRAGTRSRQLRLKGSISIQREGLFNWLVRDIFAYLLELCFQNFSTPMGAPPVSEWQRNTILTSARSSVHSFLFLSESGTEEGDDYIADVSYSIAVLQCHSQKEKETECTEERAV